MDGRFCWAKNDAKQFSLENYFQRGDLELPHEIVLNYLGSKFRIPHKSFLK